MPEGRKRRCEEYDAWPAARGYIDEGNGCETCGQELGHEAYLCRSQEDEAVQMRNMRDVLNAEKHSHAANR